MDVGTVVTAVVGVSAAVGGFFGGRKTGGATAVETAVGVVELLRARIETMDRDRVDGDHLISELKARIEILESLVTRRADVETLAEEVSGVRDVVDRIALKMGA